MKSARDRWGLQRHRCEATNPKWDPNITARDVPTKFGDDATDAAKQYLQTFALDAAPLTKQQQIEEIIPECLRLVALESGEVTGSDDWWMARERQIVVAEAEMRQQNESPWKELWRDTV